MNSFIISNDGTLTFTNDNKAYTVDKSHPNYTKIITAIKGRKFKMAVKLADNQGIKDAILKVGKNVVVEGGRVLFKGQEVGGVVVDRILKFVREGLPFKPLVRFLENIQLNPSSRSVQELYTFLEHGNMPITEDGCFIGYKAITNDWKDKHTRTFDNHVGKSPEMPRNAVDDDFRNGCSKGFHVGSYAYANSFAQDDDRIVLVKVNPADAVSVPSDCNFQKLRVWTYKVVGETERTAPPLQGETFGDIEPDDDSDEESDCLWDNDEDEEDAY